MPETHDPDILEILRRGFREFVEEVLDDPAWIAGEAPTFIAKLRKTAAWLKLDFNTILDTHHNRFEAERLQKLERGETA